ncbi:MAG: hypothetical protein HKO59_10325 [Phycisphaerales bacterium]|nr:hypothetical protein [Phycisphaerales bacterium]NNM26359.1 hypothetical protein [Phycisphaerales bacterium]
MLRVALAAVAVLAAGSAVNAGGVVVWSEDFDAYRAGSELDDQGGWRGWDGGLGHVGVSDEQSTSSPHAARVASEGDTGHQAIQDHAALGMTSGVYSISAKAYVPGGHTGASYFIIMNTYEVGGAKNWSTQVHFDGSDQTPPSVLTADFTSDRLPLITDAWTDLEVVVNLDIGPDAGDGTPVGQQHFFYDGALLYEGPWRGQVSSTAGSAARIAATGLFNLDGSVVYYDDLSIERLDPDGACCFDTGACLDGDGMDEVDCLARGGVFQGIGTSCVAVTCYENDGGVWLVDLPDGVADPDGWTWDASTGHADTCDETDDCDDSPANDIAWRIAFPRDAEYIISVCDASFDSVLSLGTTPCAGDIAMNDDAVGCGTASEIRATLAAGTYELLLEGFSGGDCGAFTLNIRELCSPLVDNPDATLELEACGDDTNGGCNAEPPVFEAIACDTTVRGTGWHDTLTRDTDWYELVLAEPTTVTLTGVAERASWTFGFINEQTCDDDISIDGAVFQPCFMQEAAVVSTRLAAGTWWIISAPQSASPVVIPCGDLDTYELTVSCGEPCVPSLVGDTDGDGFTDFNDLLNVLASWGVCSGSCAGDVDCSGDVGFIDLLRVLANWNPPP